MKKTILMIFALIIAVSLVSCSRGDDQVIIGRVTETNENGGFRIEVLDGFAEDIMQVGVEDKLKYEDGVTSEDIKNGVVIGLTIEDRIMESYPVQVIAKRIMWVETVITGTILSVGDEAMLINVSEGYDQGMMQVWFQEETLFYGDIPTLMEKQKTVGFTITGEVMESEPVQAYAKRIVTYE